MEDDSFYVTAPSNANSEKYPFNKGGDYKIDLPHTLQLSSEWEVGLSEIQYRRDWDNVVHDDLWIRFDSIAFSGNEKIQQRDVGRFYALWKTIFKSCNASDLYFHIVNYNKPGEFAVKRTLGWLKHDQPRTIHQFIEGMNGSLRGAYSAAGWKDMDSLPFFAFANTKKERKYHKQMGWPDIVLKIAHPPKDVNEGEYAVRRLLTAKAKKEIKGKRVFGTADLILSHALFNILQIMGLFDYEQFRGGKDIKAIADSMEAARKLIIYNDDKLKLVYLPVSYEVGSEVSKECEKWTKVRLLPQWRDYSHVKNLYLMEQSEDRAFKIGKVIHLKGSISSEKDLCDIVWHNLSLQGSITSSKPKGIWVDTDVKSKSFGKVNFDFNVEDVFYWRLELSLTLCRIFGLSTNQLYKNTFIIPNKLTLGLSSLPMREVMEFLANNYEMSQMKTTCQLTSIHRADLTSAINTLWVYSDAIKPSIVGDVTTQLLRTVPIPHRSDTGESCIYTFTAPFYYPVRDYTLSDLSIKIFNTYGREPIRFAHPVICQLHFRRSIKESSAKTVGEEK